MDHPSPLDKQQSSYLKMESMDGIVKRRKHKFEHLEMGDGPKEKKHLREMKGKHGVLGEIRQEKGLKKHHHHVILEFLDIYS